MLKMAVTLVVPITVRVQVLEVPQLLPAPLQLAKVEVAFGVAVKVTTEPYSKEPMQLTLEQGREAAPADVLAATVPRPAPPCSETVVL